MILKGLNKISLSELLIVALLVIILLQRCGGKKTVVEPKIFRDTVWVHTDSTIYSNPKLIKSIPYPVPIDRWNTEYLPDSNYDKLIKQYTNLVEKFLVSNVYKDSLHIDSLGYVLVKDTVSKNMLIGRTFSYDLKYPIIKETRIVPEKKHNQFYIGGLLQGNQITYLDQINIGLLFKNKKDQIYGISAGIDKDGEIQYGVSSFWKIKLHK